MTISVPISTFKIVRQQPKVATHIRIVPHPNICTLPVTWEETAEQPVLVSVPAKSQFRKFPRMAEAVIRVRMPLELRLDPTL